MGPQSIPFSLSAVASPAEGTMKALLCALFLLAGGSAFAQQAVPDIAFDSSADFLKMPAGMNFGEVPGVAGKSKGDVFGFTRSKSASGAAFGPSVAQVVGVGPKG